MRGAGNVIDPSRPASVFLGMQSSPSRQAYVEYSRYSVHRTRRRQPTASASSLASSALLPPPPPPPPGCPAARLAHSVPDTRRPGAAMASMAESDTASLCRVSRSVWRQA